MLSLSALTAYRALFTKGRLKSEEHVLIPGIGGGVATYAMLFAKAIGAKVSVTSRIEVKERLLKNMEQTFLLIVLVIGKSAYMEKKWI